MPSETVWKLQERIKELTVLHQTSRVLENEKASISTVMDHLLSLLPTGWQFPETTAVRISFDGATYSSSTFSKTPWRQTAFFQSMDERQGALEIVYLQEHEPAFEGPFLREERELIDSLSHMIKNFFDRKLQAEKMRKTHEELEMLVRERTAKLTEVNQTLLNEVQKRRKAQIRIKKYQEKLRRLVGELSLTEERERRAIAADLHDRIGQSLALMKSKLYLLHGEAIFYGMEHSIDEIRGMLNQTIADTRSLTSEICPPVLYEFGLAAAIGWLSDHFKAKHALSVKTICEGTDRKLPEAIQGTLFRIVRELLMNAKKHSQAQDVRISLQWSPASLVLKVSDNGIGLDLSELRNKAMKGNCFGLFNVRERIRFIGGELEMVSSPGKGTEIKVSIPLLS